MSEDVVSLGRRLERAGDWDGAVKLYMAWVERAEARSDPLARSRRRYSNLPRVPETPAPYPYERLAIIHRKRGDGAAEIQILQRYVEGGGRSTDLLDRLRKLQEREQKDSPPGVATVAATDGEQVWRRVCSWSGEHSTCTQTFAVAEEWRVRWSHDPEEYRGERWRSGLFQLLVRRHESDAVMRVLASCFEANAGTSYLRGSGAFYLEIGANCTRWSVVVESGEA